MRYLRAALILSLCFGLFACGKKVPDVTTLYSKQPAAQIYTSGEQAMVKHHYADAVQHFEVVTSRYPFGSYAEKSQANLVYAYYKDSDLASALAAADQYVHLYPQGRFIDYVYYLRGLIHLQENQTFLEKYFPSDIATRDLASIRQAYRDFEQLVNVFPKSKYTADAKQRMVYIINALARHELQSAQFYYNRRAYVASANRANRLIKQYPRSDSVPAALGILNQSYHKLGLQKEANEVRHVLMKNYPHSKTAQSLH
jgi:outer membrane protein assembly factor BamD